MNRPQLSLSLISASVRLRNSPAGDPGNGSWAGLAPVLVHMRVPVHLQFTHTLMFFKRHLISSGLRLFRTERRSVACHQYNICPPPSPLFIPATCIQKSLFRVSASAFKPTVGFDPVCRSTPNNHSPFCSHLAALPQLKAPAGLSFEP